MKEKRVCPRVALSSVVDYSSTVNARARNVSETGVGILTRRVFDQGTPLFLTISLPQFGLFKSIGRIMWCREIKEELYLNGIRFFSLKEESRAKIKDYVDKMMSSTQERRRTPRKVIDILIDFKMKGSAYAKNLNLNGICATTSVPLNEGKIILLSIMLHNEHTINAYGRVVWCHKKNSNTFESGIEFWDLKADEIGFLKAFIANGGSQSGEDSITA
ncbi:MAG: PilZ domain-containing protein [Spirochaetales bacterium]|nr:PilZ domain-containing protein [Spirochaetales bacterium]